MDSDCEIAHQIMTVWWID